MPAPPFAPPFDMASAVIHRRPWEYVSVGGSGAIGVEGVQRWTVENAPGHCESVGATASSSAGRNLRLHHARLTDGLRNHSPAHQVIENEAPGAEPHEGFQGGEYHEDH